MSVEQVTRLEVRPARPEFMFNDPPTAFLELWMTPNYKCWRLISPTGITIREGFKAK